jgi:hypothetical protein
MNDRIKQLALEAFQPINDIASEGIADRRTFDQAWFQLYNQKFAQLILEECTMVLFNESERLLELYSEETNMQLAEQYEVCSDQCINDMALIEKHFGIE